MREERGVRSERFGELSGLVDALRLERVRLTTVRSTWVIVGTALGLGVLVSAVIASLGSVERDPTLTSLVVTTGADITPLPFAAAMMGVLGVLSVGHDYRYGLARATLLVQPNRSALVAARLAVLTAVSVAVVSAGFALNLAVGMLLSRGAMALNSAVWGTFLGYLLLTVLWSWLGAAGTWLLRATVPTLTILLIVPLLVEPIIRMLALLNELSWLRPIADWLPFTAGRAMASAASEGPGGMSQVTAGAVFGGFVLAVLIPAWLTFRRWDA